MVSQQKQGKLYILLKFECKLNLPDMKLLKEDMVVDGMIQHQLIKCPNITYRYQLDHLTVSQLNNTGHF